MTAARPSGPPKTQRRRAGVRLWSHRTLYFATDSVALDRTCWKVIDAKRISPSLPAVAGIPPNPYLTRPDHTVIAGNTHGLGEWRDVLIALRTVTLHSGLKQLFHSRASVFLRGHASGRLRT